MCHESSGFALSDSIGIGKGTVKLEDFNSAELILVVGQNPGTNHPRMLTALRDAKKHGASVISINPLIETGMKKFKHPQNPLEILGSGKSISDRHVRININGDMAFFRGLNHCIVKNHNYDLNFILSEYCDHSFCHGCLTRGIKDKVVHMMSNRVPISFENFRCPVMVQDSLTG